jgi:hypothetical protein
VSSYELGLYELGLLSNSCQCRRYASLFRHLEQGAKLGRRADNNQPAICRQPRQIAVFGFDPAFFAERLRLLITQYAAQRFGLLRFRRRSMGRRPRWVRWLPLAALLDLPQTGYAGCALRERGE